MLITFIVLYLLASIGIGLYAATRVHNTADYAVAGRSLPLAVVIATTFATWFGSETVLGVSARFVETGLGSVVEDPFGASMCLVLVGLFFAYKLYKKNLITLGDYYRQRYGRVIEVACSAIIMFSYLGWVAAQITALGLVFNLLTQGYVSITMGMVIGTAIVLIYTLYGGMWSVAMTDFVQMIVIGVGLIAIAWYAADLAGGADKVVEFAAREGKFQFLPTGGLKDWTFFFAAAITPDTAAVICNHVSNVFGFVQPVETVAQICRERGVPLMIDASQSAGILPLDMAALCPDFIAMPGHK